MKKSILFITLLCLLLPIPSVVAAKPYITDVTGTIEQGQVLVINGSNMLNEDTSNWFMTQSQSRCEGSTPGDDGWERDDATYVTDVKLTGSKSMRFTITGDGGTNCPYDNRGSYVYRSPKASVMYARAYVRYSPSCELLFSTAAYVKMFYWMQAGVYVSPKPQGDSNGWPKYMYMKIQADTGIVSLPTQWEADHWYCVEAMADKPNGRLQVWVDGQSIGTYSGALIQDPWSFLLGFVNACPVPAGTFHMYADSISLSTQRIYPVTMVEISNSSNYSSGVKVKQELIQASEDSVKIQCDLSGLGDGPYYVWVTDNRQTQSDGYLLGQSSSSPSDTTPPQLTVTSHNDGQSVTQAAITLTGTAEDASGIKSVTVNGAAASGTTSWSRSVTLTAGVNTLTVVATDNSSNQNSTTITLNITYNEPQADDTPSSPDSGDSILVEDWESGTFDNFDDDMSTGGFAIQTDVVHGGSKALVNNLVAGDNGNGWMSHYFGDNPYKGGATVEDVTLEWSTYWSPGFQFPTGQKMFVTACFESWSAGYEQPMSYSPYYVSIGAENGQYSMQLHRKTNGDVWQDFYQNQGTPIEAQRGTWTNLQVRLKLNTPGSSDGIAQMWINGVLKLSYTNVNFRDSYSTHGWNLLMISPSATPSSLQNQAMYWDDIRLSATTGSSGGDSSSPPSPPDAPSNLRIVN